ncbi:Hypothetical protein CINCED_3A000002 [Cinara cedri]|uniref:Uncharacterized protein n=1 Tax=Cinara cedri TaxID=506608 RepID=A0A5E4NEP7_9HEMI|nr:Hypothetical protein CINCED_3A000002 [Cinara cedri]
MLLTLVRSLLNREYGHVTRDQGMVDLEYLSSSDSMSGLPDSLQLSPRRKENATRPDRLEKARYDLGVQCSSVLDDEVVHRVHKAYLEYGSMSDEGHRYETNGLVAHVGSKLTPYATELRKQMARCRAFSDQTSGSLFDKVRSMIRDLVNKY